MRHRIAVIITVRVLTLHERAAQLRRAPDAGLTTAEYLMWVAIIAGIVTAVGVTISALFTSKANGLKLN